MGSKNYFLKIKAMEKSEKRLIIFDYIKIQKILCETKLKDKEHYRGKYLPHIIEKKLPLLYKELL